MTDNSSCPECGSEDLYFAGKATGLDPIELDFEEHNDTTGTEVWEYECQECAAYFQHRVDVD